MSESNSETKSHAKEVWGQSSEERTMTERAHIYRASYENYALALAAAKKRGWVEGKGEVADFVEFRDHQIAKDFPTLAAALAWLTSEIDALKSTYGCGDVDELELIERKDRCKYCVCRGFRPVHHYVTSGDGIDYEEAASNDCAD